MAELLLGSKVAAGIQEDLEKRIQHLHGQGIYPRHTFLLVGNRSDSVAYIKIAQRKMTQIGIRHQVVTLPEDVPVHEFCRVLSLLSQQPDNHGVLIMRPLPPHLGELDMGLYLDASKDVDGTCPINLGRLLNGIPEGFAPCTAEAALRMLHHYKIPLARRRVTVVGSSLVVGLPLSMLLEREGAAVTICHEYTQNLPHILRESDVVVSATGKAGLITGACLKPGCCVIDVGVTVTKDGDIVGDVLFSEAQSVAAYLTSPKSSVGAITVALLTEHVVRSAEYTISFNAKVV